MQNADHLIGRILTAQLLQEIDETECARRNALTNKQPGLALRVGEIGTVLETFGDGEAFLIEFGSRAPDTCDWLGVLYPCEVEVLSSVAKAA